MSLTQWLDIPLDGKLFENLDEAALASGYAALENAFVTEKGTVSRFPGLVEFCDLPGDGGRVHLTDWRGDLMAATSEGRLFRIDRDGNAEDVTGVPLSGGGRVVFTATEDELVMAAGGPILRFAGHRTEVLSDDAPEATHVQFVDSFLVAAEAGSGRFMHCAAGDYGSWDPLDTFAADARPDPITCLIATPYRELLMGGPDSMEQFERLPTGDTPFFRRWGMGDGISEPYSLVFADNALWGVSAAREVVRLSGQVSKAASQDIQRTLEAVDDWSDTWAGGFPDRPLNLKGQRFILLQLPNAATPYGSKGLTLLYDYRASRWTTLYGWDAAHARPARWPGWSHWQHWDRVFVGGEGRICAFDPDGHTNAGQAQRMLLRTGHMSHLGEVRIDNVRIRVKRGVGSHEEQPVLGLRARRDNGAWSRWVRKGLGRIGDGMMFLEFGGMGCGHSWQFEIEVTDDCPVEIVKMQAQVSGLGH
jgi:hypothetical protein